MDSKDIERIIAVLVFAASLIGVFYKSKSKIEKNEDLIKTLNKEIDSMNTQINMLKEGFTKVEVMSNQVKTIFNMLNQQRETNEANQQRILHSIEKIFDKLDTKQDK